MDGNNNFFYNKNVTGNIRLIQWNCCGARGKLPQLQLIAKDFDIMCQDSGHIATSGSKVSKLSEGISLHQTKVAYAYW